MEKDNYEDETCGSNENRKQLSIYFDRGDCERFREKYPGCLQMFVRRAVKKAVDDKAFFDSVFFPNEERDV